MTYYLQWQSPYDPRWLNHRDRFCDLADARVFHEKFKAAWPRDATRIIRKTTTREVVE